MTITFGKFAKCNKRLVYFSRGKHLEETAGKTGKVIIYSMDTTREKHLNVK